jgi:hypothetical protein
MILIDLLLSSLNLSPSYLYSQIIIFDISILVSLSFTSNLIHLPLIYSISLPFSSPFYLFIHFYSTISHEYPLYLSITSYYSYYHPFSLLSLQESLKQTSKDLFYLLINYNFGYPLPHFSSSITLLFIIKINLVLMRINFSEA